MSERKKINMRVDADMMLRAAVTGFMAVMETDGTSPVMITLGQIGNVTFELGVYDMERWTQTEPTEMLVAELDDPVIYEQIEMNFLP